MNLKSGKLIRHSIPHFSSQSNTEQVSKVLIKAAGNLRKLHHSDILIIHFRGLYKCINSVRAFYSMKVNIKSRGMNSSSACPPGLHGPLCQLQCDCMNGASCHPASGQCICPQGRHGARCHRGQSNHSKLLIR